MFEVGWTEMLVIAIVMIVVVGPKDLPNMLRTMGRMTAKMRGMAGEFRRQFDEALKEAELDDVKKSVEQLRDLNPATQIRKHLDPFEKAAADVRAGLDDAMKPKPAAPPAVAASDAPATPAEPLKNGPADLPAAAADSAPAPKAPRAARAKASPAAAKAAPAKVKVAPVKAKAAPAGAKAAPAADETPPAPAGAAPAAKAAKASPRKRTGA